MTAREDKDGTREGDKRKTSASSLPMHDMTGFPSLPLPLLLLLHLLHLHLL